MKESMNVAYADLILINGKVFSMEKDGVTQEGDTLAVKDGRIQFFGNYPMAHPYLGTETKVIDLKGKMVLPGFADIHNHCQAMAPSIFALNLYEHETKHAYLKAIHEWAINHSQDDYILGNGWSLPNLKNQYPIRQELDQVCGDIPVALYDTSHHILWTNTKAIQRAGITRYTENPPGGVIQKDPNTGEPTGIFFEDAATNLVMNAFPDFSVEQYMIAILEYQKMANSFGITLAQDCLLQPKSNAIEAYKNLAKQGKLTIRFRGNYAVTPAVDGGQYKPIQEALPEFEARVKTMKQCREEDEVGNLFQMNGIKIFEDGGGPTSCLKAPFVNGDPSAEPVWPDDQLKAICDIGQREGFQIHLHAMGDGATGRALDAFQYAKDEGREPRRNTITHLMLVDDNDIQRMADLEVVAAAQPFWMCRDDYYSRMYMPFLGEERTNQFYPMKTLVDKGVVVASSSDWPVTSPNNPLIAIQCGVTRILPYDNPEIPIVNLDRNPEYRFPLGPTEDRKRECVDLATMIRVATINGAYGCFAEEITGSFAQGKSADFIILDRNIFKSETQDIAKANVLATFFEGKQVFQENQATIYDSKVILRMMKPKFPGDPTPYKIIVSKGITVEKLVKSINPPANGKVMVLDAFTCLDVKTTEIISENMRLVSVSSEEKASHYDILIAEAKQKNVFQVLRTGTEGILLSLDEPVQGLNANNIFIMRTANQICADITSIDTKDQGKTYYVKADDWTNGPNLVQGESYQIYLYADDYIFQEQEIII